MKRPASYGDHIAKVRRGRQPKATTLPRDIRRRLIAHLKDEIEWWTMTEIGGSTCPHCCAGRPAGERCTYRDAVELLELLEWAEKHNVMEIESVNLGAQR